MSEKTVYQMAVEKWGEKAQLEMMQEECAELITAISHFNRGRITSDELCGEIADVQIMIQQMYPIFSSWGTHRITAAYDRKISRLIERLKQTPPPKEE